MGNDGVTKSRWGGRRAGAGRKPLKERTMTDKERKRSLAQRRLARFEDRLFDEAIRGVTPFRPAEPPRWFWGKKPLEISLGRVTWFAGSR
jgi:hypothetical protein